MPINPTLADGSSLVGRLPEGARRPSRWQGQSADGSKLRTWWLWPHLLSLDAPAVAVVWQRWWAHRAGLAMPVSREFILGLGVCLIYLADRLADTTGGHRLADGTARHRFSARFRFSLTVAAGLAAVLTIVTATSLPSAEFRPGLCLLALAAGYFWLIHCWPGKGWPSVLPKEAVVGGMFSAGTVFFVVCRAPRLPAGFWLSGVLFAAVCFLNCALITKWEGQESDLRERSSLLNAFPRFSAHLRGACTLLAFAALAVSAATMTWVSIPVAASALLLAGLDWHARKMSADTLRVLADAVLLTPLFALN